MPNTPTQKQSHTTPANPFGPLIATSFRSNGTMRQYHDYTPAADMSTQNDPFRIGATHATKRRNDLSEGVAEEQHNRSEEGVASASGRSRSWDSLAEGAMSEEVGDGGDSGDGEDSEGSDASGHTRGRSEGSSSTLAADEDDNKETSEGEGDSDESMEDGGDEEESEVSSHTVGRSEDSDSGDDGDDEDSDEEMGKSDDEGDMFGESYRDGSRK